MVHQTDRGPNAFDPPLVLVHGFPLDSRVWADVVERLQGRVRVISLDLPGFGRSTGGVWSTMNDLADAVQAVVMQKRLTRFVFAGLSMGGYVGQAYARRHASLLAGLLLVDTKAGADDDAGKLGREQMARAVRDRGATAAAEAMLPKMLHPDTYGSHPQLVGRLDQIMRSQDPLTIERACYAMRDREDFTDHVPQLACPLGMIVGEGDQISPPALAREIVALRPGSPLHIIRGAGHLAPLEKPDKVATAIESFILHVQAEAQV